MSVFLFIQVLISAQLQLPRDSPERGKNIPDQSWFLPDGSEPSDQPGKMLLIEENPQTCSHPLLLLFTLIFIVLLALSVPSRARSRQRDAKEAAAAEFFLTLVIYLYLQAV